MFTNAIIAADLPSAIEHLAIRIGKIERTLTLTKNRYGNIGEVTITRHLIQLDEETVIAFHTGVIETPSGCSLELSKEEVEMCLPMVF
jgi:hypothetical protein